MESIEIEFINNESEKIKLKCENAKTLLQKIRGLMYRVDLDEDKGMIFIFKIPWIRTFWMKNIYIPLDIIFINRENKIIKIYEAPVEKFILKKLYCSIGFFKYVIETNKGFCRENKIKKGCKIKIYKKKKKMEKMLLWPFN